MPNTTILEMCERTFHEIAGATSQEKAGIYFYQIEACFPEATRTLQRQALGGANLVRAYLTKEYDITPVAGKYPLDGAPDLLVESLPLARVTIPDDSEFELQYVPNPTDLRYPQPGVDYLYYSVQNEFIRVRDLNGELDQTTGHLFIENGVYRPVIASVAASTTLRPELEDAFVAILKEMVLTKLHGGAPQAGAAA